MVYGTQDGVVQAKGGVLVEDGNTKISSQSLAMDLNSGKVELSGNTKVLWPKGNINAKSCSYNLQNGSLACSHTDGMISIFSSSNYRFFSMQSKYRIPTHSVYQQNDTDSIFERLNNTCRCMEDNQDQSKSYIVMKSNQLLLNLSQEEGIMSDEWIAKNAKVYSPQRKPTSVDNIPQLPFSIQAKKIAYGVNDLQLSGAKLCLGERVRVPYLTQHICLNGLPFGNFQVGYQLLDMNGWYITKPLMKPSLWFANHQAHLHVATLISLSKQASFRDRLALACSLKWNDKNDETRLMAEILVHSPFNDYEKKQRNDEDSKKDIQTTCLMTTSSSHTTIPSYSHYYSGDRENSLIDRHENGWNRCRAHFLWEKDFKKYIGKWNIYGYWKTKVFNPATAYLETTLEGNNQVSEWRELSHCLGTSFSKNPIVTRYHNGQLRRQWEVGMESLEADRIQEMEYHYGLGVSDERQETIQRSFATLEMEYLHFLWKENHSLSTLHHQQYRLPLSFVAMTGHFVGRAEKLKRKPLTARATCSIGVQGQIGKLRKKWLDFSGFSVEISQTVGVLSTFLFEREEQRTALNCGIVQQLYGNCRLGVERRWTLGTACWQPMETKLSLQLLRDSCAISTSYWMEQGRAKLSCHWLW
ncbi:hypothetical protein Gasu2_02470 [Galdieria sulphuraria]|nr:hypothetical protein Gasu2_02470 [Galdieria sulphuraria]